MEKGEISLLEEELVQLSVKNSMVRLVASPFWLKIGHCLPECDKKDLMHAIGLTFRGVIRLEIKGEFCRLKKQIKAEKPLWRGIFISTEAKEKVWVAFKYENLPTFYFDCGKVGHGVKDCEEILEKDREKGIDEFPHSTALRAESSLEMRWTADVEFPYHREVEALPVAEGMANGENSPILEINCGGYGKWGAIKGEIETDIQGEENKMKSQMGPSNPAVDTYLKTKKASWKCAGIQDPNGGSNKKLKSVDVNIIFVGVMEMESNSWEHIDNVLGLRSPRVVRRLRQVMKLYNPRMVFFMETKIAENRMEKVRRQCGFNYRIDVGANGSRGGLCLAWKEDVHVQLRNYSKNHIDILIKENDNDKLWCFTGFYGAPSSSLREETWNLLRQLGNDYKSLWLVCRDFNKVLYSFEKVSGVPREEHRIEAFRMALDDCHLVDMGYSGNWFTWERGKLPNTNIRDRLDR
ncbi:hypothetical protein Gohar_022114, partial [Gossypium harknessii]|nr:hypothetical protein [Gossypium harknessii]